MSYQAEQSAREGADSYITARQSRLDLPFAAGCDWYEGHTRSEVGSHPCLPTSQMRQPCKNVSQRPDSGNSGAWQDTVCCEEGLRRLISRMIAKESAVSTGSDVQSAWEAPLYARTAFVVNDNQDILGLPLHNHFALG